MQQVDNHAKAQRRVRRNEKLASRLYITGINTQSPVDLLLGEAAWIDSHCHRNPSHSVWLAVHALLDELRAGR
jgi:hypothetical protein